LHNFPQDQAYILNDSTSTETLGSELAQLLVATPSLEHFRLYLQGELGAGKTTLTRSLLHTLGVKGRIKSPTFALLEPYEVNGKTISHFDFYRMSDAQEWADAGFAETFVRSWLVVAEWPDMARAVLPPADLELQLCVSADASFRTVQLSAGSPIGLQIADQLSQNLSAYR
jgi:tRNA threonylcarbamoyladenosine biosynthesis protein TsaE